LSGEQWISKARTAVASARMLIEYGDTDGASNRAYYAMFDAARAALAASGAAVQPEAVRTHSGLIAAFSLHLVKSGRLPADLGRTINKAENLRLASDYHDESIAPPQALWAVEQAELFVRAIDDAFFVRPAS